MRWVRLIKSELYNAYHGSDKLFYSFDDKFIGANSFSFYGNGFYFSKTLSGAKGYGRYVYRCKIELNNPYKAQLNEAGKINVEDLKKLNYDSIIVEDSGYFIVFDNSKIKIVKIYEYNSFGQKLREINVK